MTRRNLFFTILAAITPKKRGRWIRKMHIDATRKTVYINDYFVEARKWKTLR